MQIFGLNAINCRSALARESGVSGNRFVAARMPSRASALLHRPRQPVFLRCCPQRTSGGQPQRRQI